MKYKFNKTDNCLYITHEKRKSKGNEMKTPDITKDIQRLRVVECIKEAEMNFQKTISDIQYWCGIIGHVWITDAILENYEFCKICKVGKAK